MTETNINMKYKCFELSKLTHQTKLRLRNNESHGLGFILPSLAILKS